MINQGYINQSTEATDINKEIQADNLQNISHILEEKTKSLEKENKKKDRENKSKRKSI